MCGESPKRGSAWREHESYSKAAAAGIWSLASLAARAGLLASFGSMEDFSCPHAPSTSEPRDLLSVARMPVARNSRWNSAA